MSGARSEPARLGGRQSHPDNRHGNARCSAFHPTDPAFEPSLHQHKSLPAGNAILRGRDKGPERALEVQLTVCRDKMRARIPASSGLFTSNREISVCLRLRGGAGRTRTSNQTIISRVLLSIEQRVRLWGFPGQRRARSVGVACTSACLCKEPIEFQ